MGLLLTGIEQVGGRKRRGRKGKGSRQKIGETVSSILAFCLQIALAANKIAKKIHLIKIMPQSYIVLFLRDTAPPKKKYFKSKLGFLKSQSFLVVKHENLLDDYMGILDFPDSASSPPSPPLVSRCITTGKRRRRRRRTRSPAWITKQPTPSFVPRLSRLSRSESDPPSLLFGFGDRSLVWVSG